MKRKLYVSCRVKLIKSEQYPHFAGRHATIIGYADNGDDWALQIDATPPPPPFPHWTSPENFLEPLWPGSEKITWAECAWKPVRIAA